MRRTDEDHLRCAWRVHGLAADFELLDVWRFPIEVEAEIPLEAFLSFVLSAEGGLAGGSGVAGFLFRVRRVIGRILRWDRDRASRSIPGSRDRSIRDRLNEEDRARDQGAYPSDVGPGVKASGSFDFVYRFEEEALLEISNATVHALLHLGRVSPEVSPGQSDSGDPDGKARQAWSPQLAVYVRPRGRMGRLYMMLIGPFRHAIVYPALMRSAAEGWPEWLRAWRTGGR